MAKSCDRFVIFGALSADSTARIALTATASRPIGRGD